MKKLIMSYDINFSKKGFYFEWELLSKALQCKHSQIEFLGHSAQGQTVYSTPKGNIAVVSGRGDYDFETGRGCMKYREYKGNIEKLNTKHVEKFNQEKDEYLEYLKTESDVKIPDFSTMTSLVQGIQTYTKVVAESTNDRNADHEAIMNWKKQLHEWIERERDN